jgi:hypothetical protein
MEQCLAQTSALTAVGQRHGEEGGRGDVKVRAMRQGRAGGCMQGQLWLPRAQQLASPSITIEGNHLHYITLHYITLHYITLHYITLHYITLQKNHLRDGQTCASVANAWEQGQRPCSGPHASITQPVYHLRNRVP